MALLALFSVGVNKDAGISEGDALIVNRALEPKDGSIVLAVLDGELTVQRLRITPTGVILQAEYPDYPDIRVPELASLVIWGTASVALHHLLQSVAVERLQATGRPLLMWT